MNIILAGFTPGVQYKHKLNNISCCYNNLSPLKQDVVSFGKKNNELEEEPPARISQYGLVDKEVSVSDVLEEVGLPTTHNKDGYLEASSYDIFKAFGMLDSQDKDGLLVLKEFSPPRFNIKYTFSELGIDENKLFKDVKEIKGNAVFKNSQVTDLGNLQKIGGNADFRNSQVSNLGKLNEIGKFAFIKNSMIKLNMLKNVKNKYIKPIKDKNFEEIFNVFGMLKKRDTDGLLILNKYSQPHVNFSWSDIGVNENKLFKNVKKIDGDADFKNSKITHLGQLQEITGIADFRNSQVTDLGQLKKIGKFALISNSYITPLQLQNIETKAGKNIIELNDSEIFKLFGMLEKQDTDGLLILKNYSQPDRKFNWNNIGINEKQLFKNVKEIKGDADFERTKLMDLGQLKKIGGNANFRYSKVRYLSDLTEIGGNADFSWSLVKNLDKLKKIGGNADFRYSQITEFDSLQEIGGEVL